MKFRALNLLLITVLATRSHQTEPSNNVTLARYHLTTFSKHNGESFQYTIRQDKAVCYPWMFRSQKSGKCECSKIPFRSVLCDITVPRTLILDCFCMTYNLKNNETELGRSIYGCGHQVDMVYYPLPNNTNALNDYTCGKFNRDSTLCAKCLPGFSPIVYSYDMSCINCTGVYMPYNWAKYITIAYIPLTVFFIFVVAFNFNGNFPLLKCFISICQGIVSPIAMRAFLLAVSKKVFVDWAIRILGCIYGIWNLDFFRTIIPPICVDITPLQILALDYAIAFYPLLLVLVTYMLINLHNRDVRIVVCLWRPFHKIFKCFKEDWDLHGGSIANAFATFFVLSYLKILNATADLLVYTEKFILSPKSHEYAKKYVLYNEPSVEYFGNEHLPYGLLAILIGIFVIVFPIVFLVIYPRRWFQKCLNALKIHRHNLDVFVNCFQGYYKDGTNGTSDLRWFSVLFFVIQVTIFIAFTLTLSMYCYIIGALAAIYFMYLQLSLQPYKEQFKAYNYLDGFMLLILAIIFFFAVAGDEASIKTNNIKEFAYVALTCAAFIPLIYLLVISIWWLLVKKRSRNWCSSSCLRKLENTANKKPANKSIAECNFPHRLKYPANLPPSFSLMNHKQDNTMATRKYGTIN